MLVRNRSSRCRRFGLGSDVYNLVSANRTPAPSLITTNKTSSTTNTVNPPDSGYERNPNSPNTPINVGINESLRSRVKEDEMRIDLFVHIATREWRDRIGFFLNSRGFPTTLSLMVYARLLRTKGIEGGGSILLQIRTTPILLYPASFSYKIPDLWPAGGNPYSTRSYIDLRTRLVRNTYARTHARTHVWTHARTHGEESPSSPRPRE